MSPPELIPPTSPQPRFSPGTEDSGEGFRGTGHGPFRALIVSNLKWGGSCRGHYAFPGGIKSGASLPAFIPLNLFRNDYKNQMQQIFNKYTIYLTNSMLPYLIHKETLSGRDKVPPRT